MPLGRYPLMCTQKRGLELVREGYIQPMRDTALQRPMPALLCKDNIPVRFGALIISQVKRHKDLADILVGDADSKLPEQLHVHRVAPGAH